MAGTAKIAAGPAEAAPTRTMSNFRGTTTRTGLRRLALAVAAAGLLTRALIPLGYMPGNLLAGEFMVLCPTGLPQALAAASHSHHGDDGPMLDADRACPIGVTLLYAAALPTEPGAPHVERRVFDEAPAEPTAPALVAPEAIFYARAPPAIYS